MATYSPILDSEVDADSPLTESLITRLRDNPLALISATPTELTGSGNYSVPTDVDLLMVVCVGGGGGGGGGGDTSAANNGVELGGGGGSSGGVSIGYFSTSGGSSIAYSCGSGGGGGAGGASGAVGSTGTTGGDTTFNGGTIRAKGGNGGEGGLHDSAINAFYQASRGGRAPDCFSNKGGDSGVVSGTPIGNVSPYWNGQDGEGPCLGGDAGAGGAGGVSGGTNTTHAGGGGGGGGGVPFFLRTSSFGNGGAGGTKNGAGGNATTYGAGGGGGGGNANGGSGSAGIIFVLPLQS